MIPLKIFLLATVWTYWNHECADHLRRSSAGSDSVFAIGDWLPQWYERLHGDELIAKAADCGVDTVYCHFFKGFGLGHEQVEMERTKEFAARAHANGVKVLGYCQFNSLYYEELINEIPDLEKWTARKVDGSISTYGGFYYRWSPCIECREFKAYLKKVVEYGIKDIGLDGFHFDNSYARDCHCERCQAAFRQYLSRTIKNPRETCGLSSFRNVRIPNREGVADPLTICLQRFRHAQLAAFHREMFDFVKSFGRDKLVLHNPGYGRKPFDLRGVDAEIEPKSCDFMMAENPRFIHAGMDGRLVTQVFAYKIGRCFGFKVFDSTWPKLKDNESGMDKVGIPQSQDSIDRFYAQGMIYGDIAGCPWLVRSTRKGGEVILDDPLQYESAARAFKFYRTHRERLYDTIPVARAHLLYATDTFYGWCFEANGFKSFIDASERLNAEAVPYTVIGKNDMAFLKAGELLVLPDLRFMSDDLYQEIVAAATRGVKILQTGKAGEYHETGRARSVDDPAVELRAIHSKVSEVPAEFKVDISREGIMVETQMNKKGEFVMHLLRPANDLPIDDLVVAMCDRNHFGDAELFSFDNGCGLVGTAHREDGGISLKVRNFRTMCSIVFCKTKNEKKGVTSHEDD